MNTSELLRAFCAAVEQHNGKAFAERKLLFGRSRGRNGSGCRQRLPGGGGNRCLRLCGLREEAARGYDAQGPDASNEYMAKQHPSPLYETSEPTSCGTRDSTPSIDRPAQRPLFVGSNWPWNNGNRTGRMIYSDGSASRRRANSVATTKIIWAIRSDFAGELANGDESGRGAD